MPKALMGSYSTPISSINYGPVGVCSFRVHGSFWVPSSVWIPVLASGMQPVWLDLSPTASEPAGPMVRPAQGWALTFGPNPRISHALVRTVREAGNPPLYL